MISVVTEILINAVDLWAQKTRDHRGASRPLYSSGSRWSDSQERADFPDSEFQRIRDTVVMKDLPSALTHSAHAVWLLVVVVAFLLLFDLVFDFHIVDAAIRITILALLVFFAITLRHRMPRFRPDLLSQAMLRERRCPSCAQSLSDLSAESDGCTICPECGGAWRLPDTRSVRSAGS